MTQSLSNRILAATVREIRKECKKNPAGALARSIAATGNEYESRMRECSRGPGQDHGVFIGVPTAMHLPLIDLGMVSHTTQIEDRWEVSAFGKEVLKKLGFGKAKLAPPAPANGTTLLRAVN